MNVHTLRPQVGLDMIAQLRRKADAARRIGAIPASDARAAHDAAMGLARACAARDAGQVARYARACDAVTQRIETALRAFALREASRFANEAA